MARSAPAAPKPGLRERKKQRTREAIAAAALELFAERGYSRTTLEDIAEAAEVSRATIFAYYDSKEDILAPELGPFSEQLKQRLEERPVGATTFDVLRDVIATFDQPEAATIAARRKALAKILTEEGLPDKVRARWTRVQQLLAQSIAEDLHAPADDLRAAALAAATTEVLAKAREHAQRQSRDAPTTEDALGIVERMLDAVRDHA
ncbi:MAG TPA: helix-turn-helix domain-containing protein [Solirubrobacteraceae bacterium]